LALEWDKVICVNKKKMLIWTGVALIVFFLISQPQQSAGLVNTILTDLKHGAEAVITFVSSIFT
jgi:hypothetical protein